MKKGTLEAEIENETGRMKTKCIKETESRLGGKIIPPFSLFTSNLSPLKVIK